MAAPIVTTLKAKQAESNKREQAINRATNGRFQLFTLELSSLSE
jgi:hypothetical protein